MQSVQVELQVLADSTRSYKLFEKQSEVAIATGQHAHPKGLCCCSDNGFGPDPEW